MIWSRDELHRLAADLGVGAAAEAVRDLLADVDLDVGVAGLQRLGVGVDGDELDAADTDVDHAIDGVGAAAADADDLDRRHVAAPAGLRLVVPAGGRPAGDLALGAAEQLAESVTHAGAIYH